MNVVIYPWKEISQVEIMTTSIKAKLKSDDQTNKTFTIFDKRKLYKTFT